MDELVAVHPFSTPGCITSSPDGQYAYFAEGAAVALIRADPGLPNAQQNYDTPIWRAQVASQGVTPIAMALDPEADWDETDDPNDLLLIAGGRDGLWVMEASESLSAPRAFRIDDSGNNLRPSQYGRKWCNDVELMQVDGVWYVLALFARVDHSNLRAYKLSDIRQIVPPDDIGRQPGDHRNGGGFPDPAGRVRPGGGRHPGLLHRPPTG